MGDADVDFARPRCVEEASRTQDEPFESGALMQLKIAFVLPFHPCWNSLSDEL